VFQRAWFHVSAEDGREAAHVAGLVQRFATVRIVCGPSASALGPLEPPRFAGAILVVATSEGALARASALRQGAPSLPMLALLPELRAECVDALQALGVEVASARAHPASVIAFVQRALAVHFAGSPRVAGVVRQLAAERGLTPRELQLLVYALGDEPRARIRRRLGISENTLKSEVRGLIRKCGARNSDALAKHVLRNALCLPAGGDEASERAPVPARAGERPAPARLSTRASLARPYAAQESA